MSSNSLAIGIARSFKLGFVDLLPGESLKFDYTLTHTRKYPMSYKISIVDDGSGISKFVKLVPSEFTDVAEDQHFTLIFEVPDSEIFSFEPGIHTLWIRAEEILPPTSGIGARGVVEIPFRVRVLYDQAYVIGHLSVKDGNVNELLPVKLVLENWGKKDTTVSGFISILDSDKRIINKLSFDPENVPATEKREVNLVLDTTGFLQGEYTAVAEIYWDNNKTIASTTFLIGDLDLKIKSYTEELKAGEINPFEIVVESLWNNPMEDVYAEIKLESPDGKQFSTKTPTYTLDPWKELTLKGYVDLTEATTGRYKGKVIVHFDGKSKEKNIRVDVTSKEVVEAPAPAPTVLGLSMGVFIGLLVAIIALIALNVFIVLYFIRREKSKKPKRSRRRK